MNMGAKIVGRPHVDMYPVCRQVFNLPRYQLEDVYESLFGKEKVDIKVNQIETADEVAGRIEAAEKVLGPGRLVFVHPDCGFWMLKRSIADRKIEALVEGRDLYLGRG